MGATYVDATVASRPRVVQRKQQPIQNSGCGRSTCLPITTPSTKAWQRLRSLGSAAMTCEPWSRTSITEKARAIAKAGNPADIWY